MAIIAWIVLGLVAGLLAQWILPTRTSNSWIATIILGVLGAFVGGYVGSMFGFGAVGVLSVEGIITATIGAVILLFVFRLLRK
ncbi:MULTISPECIES: GlsB/YeaQ/YmgE family stress response membrane protein [Vibrio]|jgi:uncharacterized membrane protein YeaQ/YmgE (transglycosylase-associated protein family)|uniref:GlsB/YeaQ/YmgE family stress response membrane protein n=1 Tax=Vibrio TaxID=662 RepID=UPI0005AF3108|nr:MULTISPECIES: GlsB/YeaQ/YmgE family stress response membrane protein [Vibrio]KIP79750.1 hypothetical protein SN11_01235 [Vibrio harveyi]PMO41353.1 hypothetical protein BCT11_11825 [Vibrio sp. 10N.222.52.B12]